LQSRMSDFQYTKEIDILTGQLLLELICISLFI
jgi:hypothetical protein